MDLHNSQAARPKNRSKSKQNQWLRIKKTRQCEEEENGHKRQMMPDGKRRGEEVHADDENNGKRGAMGGGTRRRRRCVAAMPHCILASCFASLGF